MTTTWRTPDVAGSVRRSASVWWLLAVVGLSVVDRLRWLDHQTGFASYERTARPVFQIAVALGALLALRWPIIGGALATLGVGGLLSWYVHLLEPWHAALIALVFATPVLVWLLLAPRRPVLSGLALGVAGAAGLTVGTITWGALFGPTHPDSVAELPAGTQVEWIWTGGVTSTSAVIVAKPGDPGEWEAAVQHRTSGERVATVAGVRAGEVVRFEVTGLTPDTEYGVELMERAEPGQAVEEATFRTFPGSGSDVTIALGSCMRTGTNGAVFDAITSLDPTLFIHTGDFHYANIGEDDPDAFRDVLDVNLARPGPSNLFRSLPIAYIWDDHDYGANDADATSPSRPAALSVYRQYVPSYLTNGPDEPIHQAFDVGDVRVIVTDVRSARSPADQTDDDAKTMLGAEQKAWLKDELLAARDTHDLTIWVNPVAWIGEAVEGGDAWDGYATERRELAEFIVRHDIDRLVMLSGDAHMLGIDDGTHTGYAPGGGPSFPVLHAAALDRPGSVKGGPYSEGTIAGGGHFGLVEISEVEDGVDVRLTGRDWTGEVLMSYEVTFPTDGR